MEVKQIKERTLKDLLEILLPKLWIVLLTAIIASMAVFTYFYTRVNTYTSSARFLVSCVATEETTSLYEPEIVSNTIDKYSDLVSGDEFCNNAVHAINADPLCKNKIEDIAQFRAMFSFVGNSDQTFSFSITHTDRAEAYNIANVVEVELLREIAELSGDGNLQVIKAISEPKMPEAPNNKNYVRNSIVAFVLGAVVASAIILMIALTDVTIRDKKRIEDTFNIPILGVIPYHDISGGGDSSRPYGGYSKDVVK